ICACIIAVYVVSVLSVFFFSSRRRHTRFSRDWSSDVCSSDLVTPIPVQALRILVRHGFRLPHTLANNGTPSHPGIRAIVAEAFRSEERRVGKECRSRWTAYD